MKTLADYTTIKTLTGMDNIMENFKFKNVSQIIDLSDFN